MGQKYAAWKEPKNKRAKKKLLFKEDCHTRLNPVFTASGFHYIVFQHNWMAAEPVLSVQWSVGHIRGYSGLLIRQNPVWRRCSKRQNRQYQSSEEL